MSDSLEGSSLLIRADATTEIGAGHVMRSLALAQEWISRGGRASFLGNVDSPVLRRTIRSSGAGLESMVALSPEEDASRVARALREDVGPTWLVLDGYHFDSDYQARLRERGPRLLVLDDHRPEAHFHADILVNQNLGAEGFSYDAPGAALLLGTRYVLLRDEFLELGRSEPRGGPVRKILVTLGGGDPEDATGAVLRGLAAVSLTDVEVRAVVGPLNPNRERLEGFARDESHGVSLVDGTDMAQLVRWCDFAVSAAGSTCWELCYTAVPFVTVVIAENQRRIADELERSGAAANLGDAHGLSTRRVADVVAEILGAESRRLEMAARASRLVDGEGRRRVVEALRELPSPMSARKGKKP